MCASKQACGGKFGLTALKLHAVYHKSQLGGIGNGAVRLHVATMVESRPIFIVGLYEEVKRIVVVVREGATGHCNAQAVFTTACMKVRGCFEACVAWELHH